ncbi:MAG: aldo/keto reductase, partial [Achromobacter piechaudii]
GVSNFTQANLQQLIEASKVAPAVNQIELHPGFAQRELRAFHEKHGIATESWSPLAQGGVTKEKVIVELAAKHGKSPAQITLRWHVQSGLIVIPKSVTPARIRENIDIFDFELSGQEMAAIDGIQDGARLGPDPEKFGK